MIITIRFVICLFFKSSYLFRQQTPFVLCI
nr:MAG TPA: hypothetical protein [Caudoviricetes sp.]